jgi:hypothetical protein
MMVQSTKSQLPFTDINKSSHSNAVHHMSKSFGPNGEMGIESRFAGRSIKLDGSSC